MKILAPFILIPALVAIGPLSGQILLIEDQGGFGPLADELREAGYTVSVRNNEFDNNYANLLDANFLDDFNLVIYGERGAGSGSVLPANVGTSLESYIQGGGNLLVTGWDALYAGQDTVMANLVRATMPVSIVGNQSTWNVVADHPITNGPFGNFTGQTFTASGYDVSVDADTARGAVELVAAGDPRVTGRVIFTDLSGSGGSVGFWNGGSSGTTTDAQPDFVSPDEPGDIFRNYVAFIEGPPDPIPGIAGPDVFLADSDGNGGLYFVMPGQYATQAIGDIVSWEWTWSGGSVLGQFPEVYFTSAGTPLTITLTATDSVGQTTTDSFVLDVLTPEEGLFSDLSSLNYTTRVAPSQFEATVRGDSLVIDPEGSGLPDIYRRSGNTWIPSTFTASIQDARLVDENTLVTGDFLSGTGFAVHRFNGSQWIESPIVLSTPLPSGTGYRYDIDATTIVIGRAGEVFVYEWNGDDWDFVTPLNPATPLVSGDSWGNGSVAVEGDLIAVTRPVSSSGRGNGTGELTIFRKGGGTWTLEDTLLPLDDSSNPTVFGTLVDIGGGVVLAERELASFTAGPVVIEHGGGGWTQTNVTENPAGAFSLFSGLKMDSDGLSFAGCNDGIHVVYDRDGGASDWVTATVTQRVVPTPDFLPFFFTRGLDFADGTIIAYQQATGKVKVFEKGSPFESINAEPFIDAGPDIGAISPDGEEVLVFLNGGSTFDLNADDTLTAEWTWAGGGYATGLQTYALLDPSVTSVTLKVSDGQIVIRETISVSITSPPDIEAGPAVTVIDADDDGTIQLRVEGILNASDAPIASWNWRWPGGTLDQQSGIITLSPAADGQEVILEAIDANGLVSETSFTFRLLDPDPEPEIIEPSDGGPNDVFGRVVSIDDGVAVVGAPRKTYPLIGPTPTGASYLLQDSNNLWQQIPLSPPDPQGDSVLVEDGLVFVGGRFFGPNDEGRVSVYEFGAGGWTVKQNLSSPDPGEEWFGSALAKSGAILAVGSERKAVGGQGGAGAVQIFEESGGTWTHVQTIDTPEPKATGGFGKKLAMKDDVLIVTSVGRSIFDGAVYLFRRIGGTWVYDRKFETTTPASGFFNNYGNGLIVGDSEIFIGSPKDPDFGQRGVVYHFTESGGSWNLAQVIDPGRDGFGWSLALRAGVLFVGAPEDVVGGNPVAGSVTSFAVSGGLWTETSELVPSLLEDPGLGPSPGFGSAVSHDGTDLIVGVEDGFNTNGSVSGKAYIYRNYAYCAPDANFEPVANAGSDIDLADTFVRGPAPDYLITEPLGSEPVTLNGSGSVDAESGIVSYEWSWDGGSATGPNPTVRFPVGVTTVTLRVTDDAGVVNTDMVDVTISLLQTPPAALPSTASNSLTVNLPVAGAKWRLSSEFDWHDSGETIGDIVDDATYRVEMLAYPGSPEILSELVLTQAGATVFNPAMDPPVLPAQTGIIGFPENDEGFGWRLVGESAFRNAVENNDGTEDFSDVILPLGTYRIEFRPVAGFATPPSRLVTVVSGTTHFTSSGYQQLASYDPAKTFDPVVSPQQLSAPHHFTGMIRTRLGRGSGTVVSERVVLTAGHLFFDENGLAFEEVEWFPQQQQGEHQAPPVTPRGILYRTSYAKLVAPNTVPDGVENLPDDDQEVDFAVLYFSDEEAWTGGVAGFLESSTEKNWLTGTESKLAVGYPQRSQPFSQRGTLFEKDLLLPLTPLDANLPPKLNSSNELSGDGGASGSSLFVQPDGASSSYPAAILLAGQGRAVYRIIDQDVTRMIKDGEDAASGNDEVLDSSSSLVGFGGLGGFTTLAVQITPSETLTTARWSLTPDAGSGYTNVMPGDQVAFNSNWESFTVSFNEVAGYATPEPLFYLKEQVNAGAMNTYSVVYEPLSGYEIWLQDNGIASDTADGDKDTLEALVEYALDRDPDVADYIAPIRMAENPSQNTFAEFEVYVSAVADGIRYKVEVANHLDDFVTGTNVLTLRTLTKANGSSDYLLVPDTQPISSSNTRFGRVVITHDRSLSTTP